MMKHWLTCKTAICFCFGDEARFRWPGGAFTVMRPWSLGGVIRRSVSKSVSFEEEGRSHCSVRYFVSPGGSMSIVPIATSAGPSSIVRTPFVVCKSIADVPTDIAKYFELRWFTFLWRGCGFVRPFMMRRKAVVRRFAVRRASRRLALGAVLIRSRILPTILPSRPIWPEVLSMLTHSRCCLNFLGVIALAILIGKCNVAISQCVDGTCFTGSDYVSVCPPRVAEPDRDPDVCTPHPAVVRISNELPRSIDYATGTLVHVARNQGRVLTVSHLIRDGEGRILIRFPSGETHEATTITVDSHWDLALLEFEHGGLRTPCVELSMSPAYRGDQLTFAGYGPRGVYQECRGSLIGYYSIDGNDVCEVFRLEGVAREGDSGGPVFDTAGRLAGVVWGTDDRAAYATYSERIRRFLDDAVQEELDPSSFASAPSGNGNVAHNESDAMERELPMPGEAEVEAEERTELAPPSIEPALGQGGPDAAPLLDVGPETFIPLQGSVEPEAMSPVDPSTLFPAIPPLAPLPPDRFAIEERNDQERNRALSLAARGAPALLAALGWTGPPSAAAIFALRLFLVRRGRQRNDASHVIRSEKEEDKRQAAPVHDEYARELADVYALSGRNAAADALLGREFEHELLRAEQSSDAGVAKWARKLRNRVSQRFQRICVERPLPAEPPEGDERL
jgi:hypothetical protein